MAKYFFTTVLFILILASFFPSKNSNTSISVDRDSPEYRYANTRLRMEGFGAKDSKDAADAIVKFNKAQQYREQAPIK